jgi:hypothetical protein
MGLETSQQRLEHRVKLLGWLVPPDDGIAEPHQTLQIVPSIVALKTVTHLTHLGDAHWIHLDEGAQPPESRIFFLIITDLVQRLAPGLSKVR